VEYWRPSSAIRPARGEHLPACTTTGKFGEGNVSATFNLCSKAIYVFCFAHEQGRKISHPEGVRYAYIPS